MERDALNQRKYRPRMLLEAPVKYRLSVAQNKANSRKNQIKTEEGRRRVFLEAV